LIGNRLDTADKIERVGMEQVSDRIQ
jgi:hypothetical protein